MSFLKRGQAAAVAFEQEEARVEASRKNNVFRFWMPNDAENTLTFVDGHLKDGMIDMPMFYEHQVYANGNWRNWFVCVGEEEPCPICEGGDNPSFCGALTVIDHSEWADKKGHTHKDEVKLYIAKRKTIKLLTKLATKRGGLDGCTFDVSRTGDDAPNVGSMFDYEGKLSPEEIKAKYGVEGALDYESELTYMPAADLRKMGFGTAAIGAQGSPAVNDDPGTTVPDFSGEL